jgi:hypothetical protein
MRRITIEEHLRQLEARRAELGYRDGEPSALNSGRRRSRSKRALLEEIERSAKRAGAANVAKTPSAPRTEPYLTERAARADVSKAIQVLERAGRGNRPIKGDELSRSRKKS